MSATTDPVPAETDERLTFDPLTVGSLKHGSGGAWGMITLIATEACLFAYLLFSFYYMELQGGRDFLPPEMPSFRLSGPNTVILILSSVAVWFGERSIKRGRRGSALGGLGVAILLGVAFVGIQIREWMSKPYRLDSDAHASLFFTVTGFHVAHVVAGLLILAALFLWTALGLFDRHRHTPVTLGAAYWHFVDVVWLTVFFSFYVTPYFW